MLSLHRFKKYLGKWCSLVILVAVVVLMIFSIIAIIASSQWGMTPVRLPRLAKLQIIWFALSIITFSLLYIFFEFDIFVDLSPLIGVLIIGMLIWTKLFGVSIYGAKRWLSLGFFTLQPSELAKASTLLLIIYGYRYRSCPIRLSISIILNIITLGLIIIQPDLGTTLVILSSILVSVFFMGIPTLVFVGSVAAFSIAIPLVWNHLKEYQKLRIRYFLNPFVDPHGHGYNIIQALTAVGAGSITGMGIYNATQAKYGFLPVATADFLFASFAQAVGFLGVLGLFLAYAILFLCIWLYGMLPEDAGRRAFIYGVLWMWFFTFWVNVGMNIGVMPVTGVPLPFFSYGGTQTLTNFILLALVLLAGKERIVVDSIKKLKFGDEK